LTLDLQALSPRLLKTVVARRDQFDRGLRAIIEEGIAQELSRRPTRSSSRSPSWAP